MLFGRRKPGFVQVEEQKDPETAGRGPEETGGAEETETPKETGDRAGKPELMSYLESLPDVEDPFPAREEAEEEPEERTPAQELADYIRLRSAGAQITARSALAKEIEDFDSRIEALVQDETCKDIASTQGNKDVYYYSRLNMSDNYAMIAALVEEKDLARTIAKMVRFNCKTYPLPTPITYFERHPYYASIPQIERALDVIAREPEYEDIQVFTNSEGVRYFYAEGIMSRKYAKALAETEEFTD